MVMLKRDDGGVVVSLHGCAIYGRAWKTRTKRQYMSVCTVVELQTSSTALIVRCTGLVITGLFASRRLNSCADVTPPSRGEQQQTRRQL